MKKHLPSDPALIVIYSVIAIVIIANIFISGYWFGRAQETLSQIRPVQAEASAAPVR